jgi:hypothetical protein
VKKTAAVAVTAALAVGVLTGCSVDDDDTECATYTTVGYGAPAPRPAAPAPRVAPPAPKPNFNKPAQPKAPSAPKVKPNGSTPVQPNTPRTHTTCWDDEDQ